MSDVQPKPAAFACQQCRTAKRRCDGEKPQCSNCKKTKRSCVYQNEPKPRKRKYWDEQYVKSLENQVQALLAAQNASGKALDATEIPGLETDQKSASGSPGDGDEHSGGYVHNEPESSQSQKAMEELSVMMWRTNLADGVSIDTEPPMQSVQDTILPLHHDSVQYDIPPHIRKYTQDTGRMNRLATLFLENINGEHHFTQYKDTTPFINFPHHPPDVLFLHGAMLAVGATFENAPDSLEASDRLAEISENLVFTCFRQAPTIHIIQGLCILSWRSLALGHDHLGWTFLSMAAGMAVHLRLHVLALDEVASKSMKLSLESVQTFWSFYMTDRTSISILGRNCILPWRRVNVPAIETFFAGKENLAELSFSWQCKLWYLHDQNMDQIFSSSFEALSTADQVHLLISTHRDLNRFFKSRDQRLEVARDAPPKPALLFHMAYQMAILITMPPFLRLFATVNNESQKIQQAMQLVLQSISSAASSMVRLAQTYTKTYGFERANPLIIHHLLSASIVHLMNTTTTSLTLRRYSTRSVRSCLTLLSNLEDYWPYRSRKSIEVITSLARRWNVDFVVKENESNENLEQPNPLITSSAQISPAMPTAMPTQIPAEPMIDYNMPPTDELHQFFPDSSTFFTDPQEDWPPLELNTAPMFDFAGMTFPNTQEEFMNLSQIFQFGSNEEMPWGFGGN